MSLRDPNPSNGRKPKRVAIVIANPATSSTTGWPVGFWWSELTHPFYAFHEAGYEVEIFSPDGGRCAADGLSDPRDASGYSASWAPTTCRPGAGAASRCATATSSPVSRTSRAPRPPS